MMDLHVLPRRPVIMALWCVIVCGSKVILHASLLSKQAVCCDDKIHCCPEGTTCDVPHSKCISSSTKKEMPMWAKLPARMRAEWENQKGQICSFLTAMNFLIWINHCLNLTVCLCSLISVCVSTFRRRTSNCRDSC